MQRMGATAALALAVAGSVAAPCRAQQARSVAVLAFHHAEAFGQDTATAERLRTEIPGLLAAELGRQPGLTAADHSADGSGPGGRIDAATAARLAKQAGARYAVTGNYLDHFGRFRLNAEIIDAESGTIVKVVSNDDRSLQRREELPRIVKLEAARIAEVLTGRP